MKKGISKILVTIVALLLGIVLGMFLVKFTINKEDIGNKNVKENEEIKFVEISGLNIINRVQTTLNRCVIYPMYGYDLGVSNAIKTETTDTSIKVMKDNKSNEMTHTDGKVIKMLSQSMHSGSTIYRFFLTENGSIYYVDEADENLDIKKVESVSGVKDIIALQTYHVYNEGRFPILETYTFNTIFAVLENNQAYDLFDDIK